MAFMQRQVTKKIKWVEITGGDGTTFVPAGDVPEIVALLAYHSGDLDDVKQAASVYYDGRSKGIETVGVSEGYGARLSAPGFMDCTEWTVFKTEKEAEDYLEETYGDDEEDADED